MKSLDPIQCESVFHRLQRVEIEARASFDNEDKPQSIEGALEQRFEAAAEDGYRDGLAQAEVELEKQRKVLQAQREAIDKQAKKNDVERISLLQSALDELEEQSKTLTQAAEALAVELALGALTSVLGELGTDQSFKEKILNNILSQSDASAHSIQLGKFFTGIESAGSLALSIDEKLAATEVRISTKKGEQETSLSDHLHQLVDNLIAELAA